MIQRLSCKVPHNLNHISLDLLFVPFSFVVDFGYRPSCYLYCGVGLCPELKQILIKKPEFVPSVECRGKKKIPTRMSLVGIPSYHPYNATQYFHLNQK